MPHLRTVYTPEPAPSMNWAAGLHDPATQRTTLFASFGKARFLRIGRANSCEVRFDSNRTSKVHAIIERHPSGRITIRDHSSTNGTYVDGRKISSEPVPLLAGMKIGLGNTRVSFMMAIDDETYIPMWVRTVHELCYRSKHLYGNETLAATRIGKSRSFLNSHAEEWKAHIESTSADDAKT